MAFFPMKKKDPRDEAWARQLYEAVRRRKIASPSLLERRKWAFAFARLRGEQGEEVITKALNWYCAHLGEEFVPVANTAQKFRDKFHRVLAAMDRDVTPGAVGVNERCRALAEGLANNLKFPVEVLAVLPTLVQKTSDAWGEFCEVMAENVGFPEPTRDGEFLNRVLGYHSPSFVSAWFETQAGRLSGMEHYSGSVLDLAFRPASKTFLHHFWHTWSLEWSGRVHTFDALLERLTGKEEGECKPKP